MDRGKFSLPSEMGQLAIHVSMAINDRPGLSGKEQQAAFIEEGEALKESFSNSGHFSEVKLYRSTNSGAIDMDIQDMEVSSIITIGHGCLGDLWLPNSGHYNWRRVAEKSRNHLKRGFILQRTCGNVSNDVLTVPWGTFALADQSKLLAAAGQAIPDVHPNEELFRPVFKKPRSEADEIIAVTNSFRSGPSR